MKIGNVTEKPPALPVAATTTAATEGAKPGAAVATQAATVAPAADASSKVEISSTASTLLSGGASSEFDAEKVARMSAAIHSGTFRANPEAIADKLIANAQELLVKVKS